MVPWTAATAPVHESTMDNGHGTAGRIGLGPFGHSGRWEFASGEGKGRGGLGGPHRGYKRAPRWWSRPGDGDAPW
jgi:hypothetical protein